MKIGTKRILLSLLLVLCGLPIESRAQELITLFFHERPPYQVADGEGVVSGLIGTPVAIAFKQAGIKYTWAKLSTNRQLETIKENAIMSCGLGWFRNAERERFAKFTKAIYQDKPSVAITPRKFILPDGITLEKTLAIKDIKILVKEGFSYGLIDPMLARLKPTIISTPSEVNQMMQMVKANRANLMFAAQEEAHYLVEKAGFRLDDFNLVKFTDSPPGEKRYVMCSKKVPDEIIQKLNRVIQFE